MTQAPTTRASLLVRLRDLRDTGAWIEFVEIYAPIVYEYGRRHGLQDADAADLSQDVLRAVTGAIGDFRYHPDRGAFRSWLFTVARTKRINLEKLQRRHPRGNGDAEMERRLDQIPARDDDPDAALWDRAYDQRLLDWAAEAVRVEVKKTTWQAFWRTAVEHTDPQDVADSLGMSVGAVYAAKSRVIARLRERIRQTDQEKFD
jgi:RNA polymerase sigma factor (sigma-70 family)